MAGLSTIGKDLSKESAFGGEVGKQVLGAVAIGAALKGIGAATDYVNEKTDRRRFNNVINYAKKRHPELRDVPHDRMMQQMNAFYALAPRVAINKELGTSMLVTTNDYGGNVDLATAKLIADIGAKTESPSKRQEEVLAFIGAGSSLSKTKGRSDDGNNGGK